MNDKQNNKIKPKEKQIIKIEPKEKIKKLRFFINRKKKYILGFLLKEQDTYQLQKRKRFNPLNNKIRYNKKLHIIDVSKPTYTKNQKLIYLIDIDKGQLFFNGIESEITQDKETYDALMSTDILFKLSAGLLEKKNVKDIFEKIIYIGLGIGIGFIVRSFF